MNNRFDKTIYIVRFRENVEIKTLKLYDKESLDYIIKKLELEEKQYVVIKEVDSSVKEVVKDLLDYEVL